MSLRSTSNNRFPNLFFRANPSGKAILSILIATFVVLGVALVLMYSFSSVGSAFEEPENRMGGGPALQVHGKVSTDSVPQISEPSKRLIEVLEGSMPGSEDLKRQIESGTHIPERTVSAPEIDQSPLFPEKDPTAPTAPTQNSNFAGISWTGWIPPDPIIAVGPNHVVVMVNSSWAIYSKTGTQQYITTLDNWFSSLSPPGSIFDPWVFYDPHAGRWVMLATAVNSSANQSVYLISVSDDNDPSGSWWSWSIDATVNGSTPTSNWGDYPKIGFDSSFAVYITANMFSFSGSYQYAKIRVIRKSELYWSGSGSSLTWSDWWNMQNEDGSTAFTIQPVNTLSSSPYEFLVNTDHWASGNGVSVWRMTKTWPPTLTRAGTVNIGSYTIPPDAEQMGGETRIDTVDCRLFNAVFNNDFIYTAFPEAYNWGSGNVSALRLLKLSPVSLTASINSTYGADGYYLYFPAISCDPNNNIFVVFNRSGQTEYASVRYTGRMATDSAFQTSAQLAAGQGYYVRLDSFGRNRWGDYSGIGIDPTSSSRTAWIYGEYATASNSWETRIGEVSFSDEIYPLSNDNPEIFSAIPKDFSFQIMSDDWAGVCINPSSDHDIRVDENSDFSSVYEWSNIPGTVRDFVVVNGHIWGNATHYAQVYQGSASPYTIEAEWEAVDLTLNSGLPESFDGGEVIQLYEASLTAGETYSLVIDITGGTGDLNVFVFSSGKANGGREDSDWSAQTVNPGGDESIQFTPVSTGDHCIIVVNENAESANYTIQISLQYPLTTSSNPTEGGTVIPPGTTYCNSGTWVSVTANPNTGYAFAQWSGDASGTTNPTSVYMDGPKNVVANFCTVPGVPTNPSPADGDTDVSVNTALDWDDTALATSYDVYFGTVTSPPFVANVSESTYDPGTLDTGTHYYWKIIAKNSCGSNPGEEWDFITEGGSPWQRLNWNNPDGMSSGNIDSNPIDEVIGDFGTIGLWSYDNNASWNRLNWNNPDRVSGGDVDNDGKTEVIGGFGSLGVWLYDSGSGWSRISWGVAEGIVCGDLDNNGQDDVILDFGSSGLWSFDNNTSWRQLSLDNASVLATGDIDGDGKAEVVAGFGSDGVKVYDETFGWTKINDHVVENLSCGDLDSNGLDEVVGDFGALGLWSYDNNTSWSMLNGEDAVSIAVGDVDSDSKAEVIAGFGGTGLWKYEMTQGWDRINWISAENIVCADLDNNGKREIVCDFGTLGVWKYN